MGRVQNNPPPDGILLFIIRRDIMTMTPFIRVLSHEFWCSLPHSLGHECRVALIMDSSRQASRTRRFLWGVSGEYAASFSLDRLTFRKNDVVSPTHAAPGYYLAAPYGQRQADISN